MAVSRARGRPHTLSHLVTAALQRQLRHVPVARRRGRASVAGAAAPSRGARQRPRPELDTAAVRRLYDEAGRAGMAQVVVWGGEPLLRQDLPELLLAARRAGLFVTLITNGWYLGERWTELRGAVDALILSLDDVGEAHDRLRGLPGLFGRLEAFVAAVRDDPLRPTLLLNTVLSRQNPGALRRVAEVARRWGAGLYFCPMETGELSAGEAGDRLAALALSPAGAAGGGGARAGAQGGRVPDPRLPALSRAARGRPCTERLHLPRPAGAADRRRRRRPSATACTSTGPSRTCAISGRTACRWPRCSVRPAGDGWAPRPRGCTKCNNPDVIELSWLWDLRPVMLGKVRRPGAPVSA